MPRTKLFFATAIISYLMFSQSCHNAPPSHHDSKTKYQLIVLDPGHFHAALLQKSMYESIDSVVKVYAPEGPELNTYLNLIKEYNSRQDNPTHWKERIYTGEDYLQKMLQQKETEKAIVVLAGNNKKKTDYISRSVNAGLNVLADKPMVISPDGFDQLKAAFDSASEKHVLLYDIMTERYAITNILQKMFLHDPGIFGTLEKGSPENPAVIFKSIHHFYKEVSGKPALRPVWYFDVRQQGEGLVDVTTHLIDLIQWECFPQAVFNYKEDVNMLSATHWPTRLSLKEFSKVTGVDSFPSFLQKAIKNDHLEVYANGEMLYTLKGIHTEVAVEWHYQAPKGSGDIYYSKIRGTKASLVIKQDKEQQYQPTLYIKPKNEKEDSWQTALNMAMDSIHRKYPGVSVAPEGDSLKVIIPSSIKTAHEQRFASVVKKYLQYLQTDSLPAWERSFMLTKYYTTTQGLKAAISK